MHIYLYICLKYFSKFLFPTEGSLSISSRLKLDQCSKEIKQRDIFFLETSGESCLTPRQACSIESAIRTNPQSNIKVLMEGTGVLSGPHSWKSKHEGLPGHRRSCTITDRLQKEINLKIYRDDLLAYLASTPLWTLVQSGALSETSSHYPLHHRSDLVRVAIMWKMGGIYLDLDCMVLRPLDCLPDNTIGMGSSMKNWVENGVMAFQAGHPFLAYLMDYMVEEFKPDYYFSIGPPTLSSALLDFCDRDELPANGGPVSCSNGTTVVHLEPRHSFYALDNKERNVFFDSKVNPDDLEALKLSYLSHIYNAGHGNAVPEGSLYSLLAREYCPITYQMAIEEGEF